MRVNRRLDDSFYHNIDNTDRLFIRCRGETNTESDRGLNLDSGLIVYAVNNLLFVRL